MRYSLWRGHGGWKTLLTENSQSSTDLPGSTSLHVIAATERKPWPKIKINQNGDNRPRVLLRDRYKSACISIVHRSPRHAGGLHYALEKSSIDARVLAAFDWDQLACRVYSHNFPETTVKQVHILPTHTNRVGAKNTIGRYMHIDR